MSASDAVIFVGSALGCLGALVWLASVWLALFFIAMDEWDRRRLDEVDRG